MKKTIVTMILGLIPMLVGRAAGSEVAVIAPGAKLEKLAGGFEFTEGPAADAQGNVFFTDQPNDRILKWSIEGKLSTFMKPCGRANGLCFDRQGKPLGLRRRKERTLAHRPGGQGHRGRQGLPGQAAQRARTTFGCGPTAASTSPIRMYPRSYWKRGPKRAETERPCITCRPTARQLDRVIDDLEAPNGIIGTPDGKTLYVADIGAGRTYAYDIQADGSLDQQEAVLQAGLRRHDDRRRGNVYLTGNGVTVFDRDGKQIEHIDVPERWTGNVCFGGKDAERCSSRRAKGSMPIRMQVRGVGSQ